MVMMMMGGDVDEVEGKERATTTREEIKSMLKHQSLCTLSQSIITGTAHSPVG